MLAVRGYRYILGLMQCEPLYPGYKTEKTNERKCICLVFFCECLMLKMKMKMRMKVVFGIFGASRGPLIPRP